MVNLKELETEKNSLLMKMAFSIEHEEVRLLMNQIRGLGTKITEICTAQQN